MFDMEVDCDNGCTSVNPNFTRLCDAPVRVGSLFNTINVLIELSGMILDTCRELQIWDAVLINIPGSGVTGFHR